MPATVIMPALELAQETGKVMRWLKSPGDTVRKGEPIVEIETDKVTVEIEAPASGVLREVSAQAGGRGAGGPDDRADLRGGRGAARPAAPPAVMPAASAAAHGCSSRRRRVGDSAGGTVKASPLARKIAEQHGVDLARCRRPADGSRRPTCSPTSRARRRRRATARGAARIAAASPKARRLAAERGVDLRVVRGSGPGGAVLAADVPAAGAPAAPARPAGGAASATSGASWPSA